MRIAFVMSRRQNHFFRELVEAVRDELSVLGVSSTVDTDGFPDPEPGLAYALVPPHEYFALEAYRRPVPAALLERSVFLCAEQPGTHFFEQNARLARYAHRLFDISHTAVAEFRRRGLGASHFQLGYTPAWSRFADNDERDVDVLFLGCESERRLRHLAGYAEALWRRRSQIVLSDNSAPNAAPSASFVTDEGKWRLLGRSKVLLNIHQGSDSYFEWLRIVQAILNGCVVVSEHSHGHAPLRPSDHFLSGRAETLALLAGHLLDDPERLAQLRGDAFEYLRDEVPLRSAVERLAEAADEAARRPLTAVPVPPAPPEPAPPVGPPAPPANPRGDPTEGRAVRRALKELALDVLDLKRVVESDRLERVSGRLVRGPRPVFASATHAAARPRVSVLVTVFDYGQWVERALASVARSRYRDLEVVVVDDGSSDDSLERASAWMRRRWDVPALLLSHPVNRGLAHARNTALGFARGELVFVLDADNALYPHGLGCLVAALDDNPEAAFSYGMLQRFYGDTVVDLSNTRPWDPALLRYGNYVDAMALVRADTLRRAGGYSTHRALYGWEDYELWLRLAERGERGVLVREIVARYRLSPHSMLRLTDLSTTNVRALLAERYPDLVAAPA